MEVLFKFLETEWARNFCERSDRGIKPKEIAARHTLKFTLGSWSQDKLVGHSSYRAEANRVAR